MAAKKELNKKELNIDGHKLMYHVETVADWLNGRDAAPIYIEIGPINSCNHRCVFCALDYLKSKGKMISRDVLISSLKNMAEFGVKSVMFGGEGEPFMHPNLPEAIEKAKEFGLDIAITTNGILFTENKIKVVLKHLSWIKFSIDAGTKETHAKIHGCSEKDFLQLMENIRFACNYRKKQNLACKIGCQILLIPDNIGEAEELILKVKELGVDYLVLKPYSQHPQSINKFVLDIDKHDSVLQELSNKYSDGDFQVIYRKKSAREVEKEAVDYDACHGLNFFTLIDAQGNVIPCNIFYERDDYYYGNINEHDFKNIWLGTKRKEVLKKLSQQGCSKCRRGCRLNFVNQYLNHVKKKDIEHINFI